MSIFSLRLQQRAMAELRKQTRLLVEDAKVAPGSAQRADAAGGQHAADCQMATAGRLDLQCARCRAVMELAGP